MSTCPTITYRPVKLADVDRLVAIENAAHVDPWDRTIFLGCFHVGYHNHVMLVDDAIVGYSIGSIVLEDAHLLSIAVDPAYQGNGYGDKCLQHFLTLAWQHECKQCFLEVRHSNHKAIALYTKHGFERTRVRKGYYKNKDNSREDAVEMRLVNEA